MFRVKRKIKEEKVDIDEDGGGGGEKKRIKNELIEKEKKLKLQNDLFWKWRDQIDKELDNDDIKEILTYNDQKVVRTGRDDLMATLADCLTFGALDKCPDCKHGQLVYSSKFYYCTGNISEWTKCQYKTQEPKYYQMKFDSELIKDFPFLKTYKFDQNSKRVFALSLDELNSAKSVDASTTAVKKEESLEEKFDNKKPLSNLKFQFAGKLTLGTNAEVKKLVEKLGGKISTKFDETICCLITTKDEHNKMSKKVNDAKALDIHVISDEFLTELDENKKDLKSLDDLFVIVLKHNLATWGADMKKRVLDANDNEKKSKMVTEEERYCSKSTGTVKMKVKGGAAVDPDSGLENEAHVIREKDGTNDPYSVVLGLVDITRGTNSFYKLQTLEHDSKSRVYIFRSWGRVGTTIGGNKLEEFSSRADVIGEFERLYLEKTGNEWSNRKSFVKKPSKFFPLEVDYGEGEDATDNSKNSNLMSSNSKLAKPIQDLIKLIFDIEKMKSAMVEFEIDLNKMPLGKLSSNQLKKAFGVLNELTQVSSITEKS